MNDYCIFYKRKSSDSEDKQILSLGSQDRVIRETIANFDKFEIIGNYEESKSAKAPGRPKFNEMCERIEKGEAKNIICWQLNRLARNSVDGGRIIWLVQNYGVKIITPSKIYDVNDILLMYVEFAMSNQFINDLKKNVARGMKDKLDVGKFPACAPIGYYNDTLKKKGLKDILPHPEQFGIVRKMWDLLLTGNYSPPKILEIATDKWGLRTKNGKPLCRSQVYELFRNIFYTGTCFVFADKLYENGIHKPMITLEEYEKAQNILGVRGQFKFRPSKRTFAFNNSLMSCICGSSITAHERYRKTCPNCHFKYNAVVNEQCLKCNTPAPEQTTYYCYYHCSKKKDPHCKQPHITLKELEKQFEHIISRLTLPEEFIEWALERLRKIQEEEAKNRGTIHINVQANLNATTRKLDNLLSKYLSEVNKDGSIISDEEYKAEKAKLVKERKQLEESLQGYGQQQDKWMNTAEKAFNFVLTAREKFTNGSKEEKRLILTTFGLNLTLDNGIVRLEYLKPYGKIHEVSEILQSNFGKFEPSDRIVRKGQTFFFDRQNPAVSPLSDLN